MRVTIEPLKRLLNKLGIAQFFGASSHVDKEFLIERFDYDWASLHAKQTAIGTGSYPHAERANDLEGYSRLFDICADINDLIWDSNLSDEGKLGLFSAVYEDIPAYSLLSDFRTFRWPDFRFRPANSSFKRIFWTNVRKWMSDTDETIADPIAYSLWCDYFEDSSDVEEAWNALTAHDAPVCQLKRVLEISGPVPWSLKIELYGRLIHDSDWHLAIFLSIVASEFDVYGKIDRPEASQWLERLELTDLSNEHEQSLLELRERLSASSEQV